MGELMIAVALWCGSVPDKNNVYTPPLNDTMWTGPQATMIELDKCRQHIIECLDKEAAKPDMKLDRCFKNEKLSEGSK